MREHDDRGGVSAVLTGAKKIDNRALNLAGIQPLRALLARWLYNLRPASDDPRIRELSSAGIVTCEDFLAPEEFTAITHEAEARMAETPASVLEQGRAEIHQFPLDAVDANRFPQLARWRRHEQVMALVSAAERRRCRSGQLPMIEQLRLGDDSEPDPMTALHADTFFTTHKVWLYLDDVSEDDAAFVYVPGSHVLDSVRVRHEYTESTRTTDDASRRVSDDEVRSRGLARRVITCPRNTLVIANTCGYHARGVGESGTSRRALFMMVRFNPFSFKK